MALMTHSATLSSRAMTQMSAAVSMVETAHDDGNASKKDHSHTYGWDQVQRLLFHRNLESQMQRYHTACVVRVSGVYSI